MQYYQSVDQFPPCESPLVLTIGNFDGVHPGHQYVIKKTVQHAATIQGKSVIMTFCNHPSEILCYRPQKNSICTLEHKIALLSDLSIDYLVQIPFTLAFSKQAPDVFIHSIRQYIPFRHLVLGYDARFGKDRQGDRKTVMKLAQESHFSVEYIEPVGIKNSTVSSSLIRTALQKGLFDEVEQLLGRPYSIVSHIICGEKKGRKLGYPTININVSNLCLPPFGVYAVFLKVNEQLLPGVANLGVAPTLKNSPFPVFEVFLFENYRMTPGESVEIFPQKFIRSEKHFSSIEALKKQISDDVVTAKNLLKISDL